MMNRAAETMARSVDQAQIAPAASLVCPVCGQAAGDAPLEVFHASRLFACTACDLHFWHPVSMPDAGWHESAYQGRDHTAMPLEPGHRFFLSDPKAPRSGRLLDIGCGVGNFLAAARDAGFDVTGIELNQNAARFAREHYGLPRVVAMRPKEFLAAHPDERFDVVTFFEVLEHQDDPAGFIDLATTALVEDGYIALSVPNRNRWQKGADALDCPPNHLTRWSRRALSNFCELHGFEVLSMREEPLGVRRAAQVLSSGLRTHLVSTVAGETPPTLADLAEMAPGQMESTMARLVLNRRHRLASFFVRCKNLALMPLAGMLLPYLRLRRRTGLYLYCLARRRRKASSDGSAGSARV